MFTRALRWTISWATQTSVGHILTPNYIIKLQSVSSIIANPHHKIIFLWNISPQISRLFQQGHIQHYVEALFY
jgi:hypothetical protein